MVHPIVDDTPTWVTVARKVVIKDGRPISEAVPWNQTIKPEVRWKSERKASDEDVVRKISDDIRSTISMEMSPDLERLNSFMSERTLTDGTYVGFVAVKRVLLAFTLNCSDGRIPESLDPTFVSWADSEIGVVNCSHEPDTDAPAASRNVKLEYC